MTQQEVKHNYNKTAHINNIKVILRASSSGDQGDRHTEPHRSHTIEGHTHKDKESNKVNLICRKKTRRVT